MFQPPDGSGDDKRPPYTRPVARVRLGRVHEDPAADQQSRQTAPVRRRRDQTQTTASDHCYRRTNARACIRIHIIFYVIHIILRYYRHNL